MLEHSTCMGLILPDLCCMRTCVVHVLIALWHVAGESNGGIRGRAVPEVEVHRSSRCWGRTGKMVFSCGKTVFSCGRMVFSCGKMFFSCGRMVFSCGRMVFSCGRWSCLVTEPLALCGVCCLCTSTVFCAMCD